MKIRRRMEIEIRKEKLLVVRRDDRISRAACPACGAMVTLDEAVGRTVFGSRTIFRLIEAGRVHFREDETGLLVVCLAALSEKND